MEVASFTIGLAALAGLLSSCIEVVDKIESFTNFEPETRYAVTRFKSDKILLQRWADAVGVVDGQLKDEHHTLLDDPAIQSMVKEILFSIYEIFQEAEGTSKKLRPELAYNTSESGRLDGSYVTEFQKLIISSGRKSKRSKIG